jgi:hypothetical protein
MALFREAHDSFLTGLNPHEKSLVDSATDPDSILEEVKSLEKKHRDESTTRDLIERINPFIRGVEQYGKAFDVITNAKPEVLSLLWGGARILLHVRTMLMRLFNSACEKVMKNMGLGSNHTISLLRNSSNSSRR